MFIACKLFPGCSNKLRHVKRGINKGKLWLGLNRIMTNGGVENRAIKEITNHKVKEELGFSVQM